jgi:hypothetical protein
VGSKVEVHDPTRPTLWSGDGDVSIDASVECAGHLQSEIRVFKRLAVVQRQGGDDDGLQRWLVATLAGRMLSMSRPQPQP